MPEENNAAEKAIWFLAGMAVGAGLGILFAPRSGRETRRYLSRKTAEGREYITETGRRLYERGKDMVEDVEDLVDRGRRVVERVRGG
jgi:gas vesicle protein